MSAEEIKPYYPAVVDYEDAGVTEFILRDAASYHSPAARYDVIKDMATGEVIGFSWPMGSNPGVVDAHPPRHVPAHSLQKRVKPWMDACFGPKISADKEERNHRFLEEALELVQAAGCTRSEAHQLVDYVFDRPAGALRQEIGGVMITLAALCLAHREDMHLAGETELARIWTMVEKIRMKQASKPRHSPLPEHAAGTPSSFWAAEGKKDPHAPRYDCERAELTGGEYTDDEVAAQVGMLRRQDRDHELVLTIARDRIRWLSRKLVEALARIGGANVS